MRPLLLALIVTSTFGCASKPDQQVAPSPSSARQAEPATRTPNQQEQDRLTETESARGEAKTNAQIDKEAVDAELAKSRNATHDKLQGDFDSSDRRFNGLKEKLGKATGTKKKNATTATADATKREATVMASIAKLRDATGPKWDAAKMEVEADMAALDRSIDALETTLK